MIKILLIAVVVMIILLCIAAIKEEKDALSYKRKQRGSGQE